MRQREQRAQTEATSKGARDQRREIQRGQREAREQMLDEVRQDG